MYLNLDLYTKLCPSPEIVDTKTRLANNEWAGGPQWKGRNNDGGSTTESLRFKQ